MRLLIIAMVFFTSLTINALAGIQDGLIIYFSFDKVDGKTIINEANANLNGTLEADAKIVDGYKNKGLGLNVDAAEGTPGADFVRVADAPEVNADKQFSLAMWAKATNFGAYRTLMSKTDGGSYAFTVEDEIPTGWIHISGDYLHIVGKTKLEKNKWYHLAMTFDGNDGIIYLNGKQDGKASKKGTITANNSDFMIGAEPNGKAVDQSYPAWHGILDDFYFYNRALAENEIELIIKQVASVEPIQKLAIKWAAIKAW
ncbi:TPA: LamG domain-containing protein [bacterium]|nr:LamG domain-containing protein [bacterium]